MGLFDWTNVGAFINSVLNGLNLIKSKSRPWLTTPRKRIQSMFITLQKVAYYRLHSLRLVRVIIHVYHYWCHPLIPTLIPNLPEEHLGVHKLENVHRPDAHPRSRHVTVWQEEQFFVVSLLIPRVLNLKSIF